MKGTNVKKYYIEAVIWEDHTHIERGVPPDDPDNFILPTLSVGIVFKETDKLLVLVTDIERFRFQEDNANFMMIFKSTILNRKKYGKIKLADIT